MPSVSPPRELHAPHSTPERIRQPPALSSATVLPPPLLPADPKCSNGFIAPPNPLLPSDGRDWGQAHLADALLRRSLLPPFSDPAFPSAFPPVPPALPSYPVAPGPLPSSASMFGSLFFRELLCFFKVDLLSRFDCTLECVDHR